MSKKLQVFVSSTFEDLKVERQDAVAAILKAGHIPAGMELFTAGDQSQLETIKAWIDQSDVYMLILGGRYGSIEPSSGLSYTELEFDYAVSTGKPLFSVVIKQEALERKVQSAGTSVIETKNGNALEAFRKKVLSYVSSFFEDNKDIRLTVYESLANFSSSKDLVGWIRGDAAVDPRPFLEEITKLSDSNTALQEELASLRQKSKKQTSLDDYEEIMNVLKATKLDIPKTVAKAEGIKLSLMDILTIAQNSFSTGFTNKVPMSDEENFLFFYAAPKLQIHGLVQYEKLAGVQYRRCSLTDKGAQFLSEHAKRTTAESPHQEFTDLPKDNGVTTEKPTVKKRSPRVKKLAD